MAEFIQMMLRHSNSYGYVSSTADLPIPNEEIDGFLALMKKDLHCMVSFTVPTLRFWAPLNMKYKDFL